MPSLNTLTTRPSLLAYAGAAAGLVGGIAAFALLPFAATAYILPLGTALGGAIGVAQAQSTQQKIVDGALGAFCGALAAVFIPASPLAALGAVFGYGTGKGMSMMAHAVSPRMIVRTAPPQDSDAAPATSADGATNTLKSGLRARFTHEHSVAPAQPHSTATSKTPEHKR